MAGLLVLTSEQHGAAAVLPSLALLDHHARLAPMTASALVDLPEVDVLVVDGRRDLAGARSLCRLAVTTAVGVPILLVLTEGGLTAVSVSWGADDVVLDTAGPAELAARLRLLGDRTDATGEPAETALVEIGELVIDAGGYTARVRGRILDLTYKEFELLKYLAQHPSRVFTRAQLLQEVWGYDYYGGTRTVDVHVRRLRAKLGVEHDHLIGTVRNVGYRFDPPSRHSAH
ncbi:response regulator transcription factor [Georgenia faecalis]|uniref:DNA-binding response regulator n=1 Tax=Georgenia faecalis TaxID=2483799 RepID=A0ABV9DD82_9MICO|nr:response regulator transcription factor [Georgenia faecalis]